MKHFYSIIPLLIFLVQDLSAQLYRTSMQEDFTQTVDTIFADYPVQSRNNDLEQLPGFPKVHTAHPNFKNVRNLSLADLTQNGRPEIIMATNHSIYAYSSEGLLWEKPLSGVAIYPPSVADLNQDGLPAIVQATGGIPAAGRVYVLDHNGNDLPGWPLNLDNNWIITAPALADVDSDGMMEIIFNERDFPAGRVHILNQDGSSFSADWPLALDHTPAVTPSIGDVDNDGEKDIVVYSTHTRYIFGLDGQPKAGFPIITHPQQRYSFQSPILVDLDADDLLEIVGATHGDTENPVPHYYIMNHDGSDRPGWPQIVPDSFWTFSTATVVEIEDSYRIFMSRPLFSGVPEDMLYGWDPAGNMLANFPIEKVGGLEGIISIADIDDDSEFEILFTANVTDTLGFGFIHAYELDGSGEVAGFPLRPRGWTYLNGANLGDINGDGMMDLAALSYTQTFGAGTDSVYLNVYDLEVPYEPERVLWSTYKGSNTRDGLVGEEPLTSVQEDLRESGTLQVYPNPVSSIISVEWESLPGPDAVLTVINAGGQILTRIKLKQGTNQLRVPVNNLPPGVYWIIIEGATKNLVSNRFFIAP